MDLSAGNTRYTETITQTLVTTYTYDAVNRLTWVNEVEYTHDNRGNLAHDGVYTYILRCAQDRPGMLRGGSFRPRA